MKALFGNNVSVSGQRLDKVKMLFKKIVSVCRGSGCISGQRLEYLWVVVVRGEQKFRVPRSRHGPGMDPLGPDPDPVQLGPKKGLDCIQFQFLAEFCQTRYLLGIRFDWFRIGVPGGSRSGYPVLRIGFLSYLNSEVLNWENGDE